ncbi:hypothetical protein DPEC_G00120110 [Dallia pectoralis]|uniref:Uncharacterized protein n=1 Tax=Dallia pectoralis TaxID=75939 RepID=A0ACC2GQB5_DALPE|nr:hypothetical protein DPEC_G00120110 [Dallia pectoralis]
MSAERYSTMDEPSLRNLLDGTMDLDERRLIRSAIRDLRLREIEDMEAALSSKRFRPTSLNQNDNKENQLRNRSDLGVLDVLSVKLQSIQDIEELTALMRGSSEYEERKLIRAAIRRLREEQQSEYRRGGTEDKGKTSDRCLESEVRDLHGNVESGTTDSLGEGEPITSQIREQHSQQTQQGRELHRTGSKSGMVLVLDPLVKEEMSGPLMTCPQMKDHLTSLDPDVALSHQQCSTASERSLATQPCLDSGASDKSLESHFRTKLDSGTSDSSVGGILSGKRLDSGTSDLSVGVLPVGRGQGEEPEMRMGHTSSGTDSEAESTSRHLVQPCQERYTTHCDQSDGGVLSRKAPGSHSGLLNGSSRGTGDVQEQKVRNSVLTRLNNTKDTVPQKEPVLPSLFGRANSVRDRMRKFTEPSPSVPVLKRGSQSLRNGTFPSVLGRTSQLCEGPAKQTPGSTAFISHHTDRLGTSHTGTTSYSSSSSNDRGQYRGPVQPGGVAGKPQQSAGQSLNSVGGTKGSAEKLLHTTGGTKEDESQGRDENPGRTSAQRNSQGEEDPDMKTFMTIEIKDGRTTTTSSSSQGNMTSLTPTAPRITSTSMGQRAELTLGLRPTPFKITTSGSSFKMETRSVACSEPAFVVEPSVTVACCQAPVAVPNGSAKARAEERSGKLTAVQLAAIDDEELLDKMLDESTDFEERKMIRLAMRDLRKRKREDVVGCAHAEIDQREREREVRLAELRQQREERAPKGCTGGGGAGEVVVKKVEKSADGSTLRQVTKTDRFAQSGDGSRVAHSTITEASYVKKTDVGTVQSKSYSFTSSTSSSSARKVGSVFDREDDSSSRALERKQAEKRKELMRAQTMPKTSAAQSRKAMIDKLEKESGGPGNKAVAKVNTVQRSASCMVPNANSIKQMLLDWCRAKTRSYENIDIQNFSSSWSDGMAFCALVHNFFPEAFDYSSLNPANRRHNFEVAFSTAEKLAECPELLDVDDMVRLREPDWKCVYTYLQEFYRALVTKGLVKTKRST